MPAVLARPLGSASSPNDEAGIMSNKQLMSVEDAALALVEVARDKSLEDFAGIAEIMLEEASPGEIAAIAAYLPDALSVLLPRRTLH